MAGFAGLNTHYLFECQRQWKQESLAILSLSLFQYTRMYLDIYHVKYVSSAFDFFEICRL